MELNKKKGLPHTSASVSSDHDQNNQNQAEVKLKKDLLGKNRRGGRRARRTVVQHEAALSTAAASKSKSLTTAVVSVSSDTKTLTGDKRPVNCAPVRRRAKLANTTVTKVVTGVSLDALRAKRNGTYAENLSGGDAKTIEEVSRILFMYASRQHHGDVYNFVKRCGSFPDCGTFSSIDTELGNRVDISELAIAPPEVTATNEVNANKTAFFGRGFVDIRDVYDHLLSLVRSGKLPAESLDVLHAILPYTSRGGKPDIGGTSKYWGDSSVCSGPTSSISCSQQPWLHQMPGMQGCIPQHFQSQEQQANNLGVEGCLKCGDCSPYSESAYFCGMDYSEASLMPFLNSTDVDGAVSGYECSYPFFNQNVFQDQQVRHINCHDLSKESAKVYGEYTHCHETVLQDGVEQYNDVNDNSNDNDDDDDADVTAILHDIRDVMQLVLSPQRRGRSSFQSAGVINEYSNESLSSVLPAPCVTVSQAERETLRSLQQKFLARVRGTGSSEWGSLGLPPSEDLFNAFSHESGFGELTTEQEQTKDDFGKYATNRTLFSYHTMPFDEGEDVDKAARYEESGDDTFASRPAAVTAVAADVALHDKNISYSFYQHDFLQQEKQRREQLMGNSDVSVSETRVTHMFAMPSESLLEEEKKDMMNGEAAVVTEKRDHFGSCVIHGGGYNRAKSEKAETTSITAAPLTPYRQWFGRSGCAESVPRCISTTPKQPTTQKKELTLFDGRSPYSPTLCELAFPMCLAASVATMRDPASAATIANMAPSAQEGAKIDTMSVVQNAMPFMRFELGD